MKIRKGFVSNSSSSSFILATKTEKTKPKIEIELDLANLSDVIISTKKELDDYYLNEHRYGNTNTLTKIFEENEYLKDDYADCIAKLMDGYTLFLGSVGSEDENPLSYYLYNNGFPKMKDFEVLQEGN